MGREHLQRLDVSWGHEPLRLTEARSGPRVCDPQPARFMGSPLSFFACIGTMNHPLTRPPGTLSPSEGERDGVRGRFMERLAPPSCITRFKRLAGVVRAGMLAEPCPSIIQPQVQTRCIQ